MYIEIKQGPINMTITSWIYSDYPGEGVYLMPDDNIVAVNNGVVHSIGYGMNLKGLIVDNVSGNEPQQPGESVSSDLFLRAMSIIQQPDLILSMDQAKGTPKA